MSQESTKPVFNRKNPLVAKLKKAEMLTKPGSGKDTRHYEIDLLGSGMTFEPGDSLAILKCSVLNHYALANHRRNVRHAAGQIIVSRIVIP